MAPTRAATKRVVLRYPETDHMGEHEIQRLIAEVLRPLLERFLVERGKPAHVGADQFIYWEEGNPTRRLAPDVYVLPGVDRDIAIRSWKVWETGIVPSFALEVVGSDTTKDYEDAPVEYGLLGVRELVVFDPHAVATSRSRVRWQVFRNVPKRGFVRVDVSQGDRVRSKVLGAWLRATGAGDRVRVRIGVGEDGDELYPTELELERAEREAAKAAEETARAAEQSAKAAEEAARVAERAARAEAEAERAARLRAEAELEELRRKLAKLER